MGNLGNVNAVGNALNKAAVDRSEKVKAFRRLSELSGQIEIG